MNFWKRLFGHFRTITKHRHKVIANCAKAGILWQGLRHDLSKYTPTEFVPGVKYLSLIHICGVCGKLKNDFLRKRLTQKFSESAFYSTSIMHFSQAFTIIVP